MGNTSGWGTLRGGEHFGMGNTSGWGTLRGGEHFGVVNIDRITRSRRIM